MPDLLELRADREPDRTALLVDGRDRLTFGEWRRRSDAAAHGLVARGVRPGDRVAALAGDGGWLDYAVACQAILKAGAAVVHLSRAMADDDVAHRIGTAGVTGVVHDGASPPGSGDSAAFASFAGFAATPAQLAGPPGGWEPFRSRARADGVADLAFSSGTTSAPKAIAVPHANVTYGHRGGPDERLFPEADLFLSAWPVGTNASQATLLGALTAGPVALVVTRLDPEHLAGLVGSLRAGAVMLGPRLADLLARSGAADRYDLSSVRAVGVGSAPVPPATRRALAATFPAATVSVMYSSVESSPAFTSIAVPPGETDRFGSGIAAWSVGTAAPGTDVGVTAPDGTPVAPGEVGEVRLRSPGPRRHHLDPALSAATFLPDGWVRTGDLGRLDAGGVLHLFDRAAEAPRVGATLVSTPRVEAVLVEHPAVLDAAVFGEPGPDGTRVVAAVVLRDGATGAPAVPADLDAYLAGRLDPVERPAAVRVVPSLPRNLMGKVTKRRLREGAAPDAGAPGR